MRSIGPVGPVCRHVGNPMSCTACAAEALAAEADLPDVHNHGAEEGRGLSCGETNVDGVLTGWCVPCGRCDHSLGDHWRALEDEGCRGWECRCKGWRRKCAA